MNNVNKLGKPQVQLSETEPVVCEKCGCNVFQEGLMMRRVSPLLTGTGQPGIVPIPVFQCSNCGWVNREFLPKEIADSNTEEISKLD